VGVRSTGMRSERERAEVDWEQEGKSVITCELVV
jgi:hypothetical protein